LSTTQRRNAEERYPRSSARMIYDDANVKQASVKANERKRNKPQEAT
jgi:hypothetical protein